MSEGDPGRNKDDQPNAAIITIRITPAIEPGYREHPEPNTELEAMSQDSRTIVPSALAL